MFLPQNQFFWLNAAATWLAQEESVWSRSLEKDQVFILEHAGCRNHVLYTANPSTFSRWISDING